MPRQAKPVEPAIAPANSELSPLECFAVAKAVSEGDLKTLRPRLKLGEEQLVDVTVRIHGHVNVAGSSTCTQKESAKADQVLAWLLSQLSPRVRKPLVEAAREAFAAYRNGGELPKIDDEFADHADDLLETAARKVNKTKAGAVSAALAVELIERGDD